jgi:hypothetical protein
MCNKEVMLWTFSELLLGILVLFAIIVGLLVLRSKRQHIRNRERSIQAVVTEIHVEAGNLGSGWVITAVWRDDVTGQSRTFRSRRLTFRPRQQVGESVTVIFDPNNPVHYRMEL